MAIFPCLPSHNEKDAGISFSIWWRAFIIEVRRLKRLIGAIFLVVIVNYALFNEFFNARLREIRPLRDLNKEEFIGEFFDTDIGGAFDGTALATLCGRIENTPEQVDPKAGWNDKVILECAYNNGGYGNIRERVLNCLRTAIEVRGALILPTIEKRNPNDIAEFRTARHVPFSYLFDEAHFRSALREYCPGLHIYSSIEEALMPDIKSVKVKLEPAALPNVDRNGKHYMQQPHKFRPDFNAWLHKQIPPGTNLSATAVIISLQSRTMYAWSTSTDSPSFVRNFGRLTRFNEEIRRLAASVLYGMKTAYGMGPSFRPVNGVTYGSDRPAYVAIHLRAEKDAKLYHFTDYEAQLQYYSKRLLEFPNAPVYVACGERTVYDQFVRDLRVTVKVNVTNKMDLLDDDRDILELSNLSWDQQALVDQLVMERATYVLGVESSTFSWTLAMHRAGAINHVTGGFPSEPCEISVDGMRKIRGCRKGLGDMEVWRDDLTALVGYGKSTVGERMIDTMPQIIWP